MNMESPAGPGPLPLDFDPDTAIDWTPTWHRNVTSYPWAENDPRGYRRAAGMFDEAGNHIPESHCWRYSDDTLTVIPKRDDTDAPFERIKGRWLFAGLYYAHFGHFLVESTSRLYALAQIADVDGIFFYPKMRATHEFKPFRQYKPVFQHLGLGTMPARLPQEPVTIEEIAFPPPAFGIGEMAAGRPEYRAFMRDRLTRDTPATDGAQDLYISRSGLNSRRGRIVLEEHLEGLMAAEGYHVFHPQGASFSEQVAQYRAARRIVALDGSALHLAAMVVEPGTEVGIINRGPSMNVEDYIRQFRAFANIDPTRVEAIRGCWHPADRRMVKREVQAHLDFPAAARQLSEAGFIKNPSAWSDPPQAEVDLRIAELARSYESEMAYKDLR